MDPPFPELALAYGFENEPVGTHLSRTIMLADLRRLLAACPPTATPNDLLDARDGWNYLAIPITATREK